MILKKYSSTFIFLIIILSLIGIIRSFLGFTPDENSLTEDEIILLNQIDFDLDKIIERGKIKVLTENSSTSYEYDREKYFIFVTYYEQFIKK